MDIISNRINGGLLFSDNNKIKDFCLNLFFEKESEFYIPNKKLFIFLRHADNLHDFEKLKKDFDGRTIKDDYSLDIGINKIKIPKKEYYEKQLFNTFYILIRLYGKIIFNDKKIYENFKKIINKQKITNIDENCIIDNKMKTTLLNNLELLIFDVKNNKIENNNLIVNKIKQLEEEDLINDINDNICNSITTLTKILDGSASEISKEKDISEELIIPSYFINFKDIFLTCIYKYTNYLPSLILKNNDKIFLSIYIVNNKSDKLGWFFDDENIDSYLKDFYKLLISKKNNNIEIQEKIKEFKKNDIFKRIQEKIRENNFGSIYTISGLVVNKEKIFNLNFIDYLFDKQITNDINYLLKNLGDLGMAFNASFYGYHFSTTDNIAKIYFLIFNFYKFMFNEYSEIKFKFTELNVNKKYGYLI